MRVLYNKRPLSISRCKTLTNLKRIDFDAARRRLSIIKRLADNTITLFKWPIVWLPKVSQILGFFHSFEEIIPHFLVYIISGRNTMRSR